MNKQIIFNFSNLTWTSNSTTCREGANKQTKLKHNKKKKKAETLRQKEISLTGYYTTRKTITKQSKTVTGSPTDNITPFSEQCS